jgi:2,3-bisphosphoglycerate-independent phosphoglycerate mutase
MVMDKNMKFVHIFFMDGVGLGGPDPDRNPFVTADLPHLSHLLGRSDWYLQGNGVISSRRASLIPTDPNLGVEGRPQSATGQATILTGRNVPRLIGKHYGPKPNPGVTHVIRQGTLFDDVVAAGGSAALITPYPKGYFDAINSGKRMYSAVPLAVAGAGLPLFGEEELRQGKAVSPEFTSEGWRNFLGYDDMPVISLQDAGRRIAAIARNYDLSFFEHWPSDRSGHRGSLEEAAAHLQKIDVVIGGLVGKWDDGAGLLIITSDHGNIEEKDHRRHTFNPVPTILVGAHHAEFAQKIHDLADIAGVVREYLNIE